jgi:hypothetical protein
MIKTLGTYQGGQNTNFANAAAEYAADIDLQAVVGNAWPTQLNLPGSSTGALQSFLQALAAQTVNRAVFNDNPQFGQLLQDADPSTVLLATINEVIRQMAAQSYYVYPMGGHWTCTGVISIAAGGSSTYAVGDILTATGGTGTEPTFLVTKVAAGVVTEIVLLTAGSLTVLAANPVSTSGGGGTLCTLNLAYAESGIAGTVTMIPGSGSGANVGNGQAVFGAKRGLDGLVAANSYSETVQMVCTADSYIGGATAGNEQFTASTVGSANVLDWNWPQGSGVSVTLNCIDGSKSNASGNVLLNSDFEAWVSTVLTGWTITNTGSAFSQDTGAPYSGLSDLILTGNGSGTSLVKQLLNNAAGSPTALLPLTQYSLCLWMKRDSATTLSAAAITIELWNETAGTVIEDITGVPNQKTIALQSVLTTSYAPVTFTFRTPEILPASYSIRIRETDPVPNTRVIYMDKLGMGIMSQLYASGPMVSVHSGSIPFVQWNNTNRYPDGATVVVVNSRGAAGTLNTWQCALSRLLSPVLPNGIVFPSIGTAQLPEPGGFSN